MPDSRHILSEGDRPGVPGTVAGAGTVAIVIPVFKHSALLAEAIESALAQRSRYDIRIVIVDDGCPFPETEQIGRAYALTRDRVEYLRKPNGGLSSARNRGIDHCLATMPDLAAVYFLDADNRITPIMIEEAMALLERSPGVDWIYPNIDKFGIEWAGNYGTAYSRLLHVAFDNVCEAGSLVSRRLLDAGIRFDETMKSGFEDWDFWLQSIGAGFVGRNHPHFGFDYRQRAESMLRDSNRVRSAILSYLRDKHKALFAADTLLRWEHDEAPRYGMVCPESNTVSLFTDPTVAHRTVRLEDYVQEYWAAIREPDTYGAPPYLLFMKKAHLQLLTQAGLVHNILWLAERLSQKHHFVALRLENDDTQIKIDLREIGESAPLERTPIAWMCRLEMLKACVDDASDDWVRSLRKNVPSPKTAEIVMHGPFGTGVRGGAVPVTATLLAVTGALRDSGYATREPKRWMWRSPYLPERSKYNELLERSVGAKPVMPRLSPPDGPVRIGFLLPIATFGGVEKVAYAMAAELSRLGCEAHLYVLGKAAYRFTSKQAGVFKTVNFLCDDYPLWGGAHRFAGHDLLMGGDPAAKLDEILGLLSGLDVVVNCQVAPVNAALGELRRRGVKVLGHFHVLDQSFAQRDAGHPYLALAFEHAYDLMLTCSQDMIHWLHGMGVPLAKLLEIRNAPSYPLGADTIAAIAAGREACRPDRPLRALYMGRLDAQKGVERLYGAALELRRREVPIDWRVVGSEVLAEQGQDSWTARFARIGIAVQPPIFAEAKITEQLAEADVLVLPSRWEGAPLTILEAQRLGCVPVVVAVGATGELIEGDVDGVLVEPSDDWAVTLGIADSLQKLAAGREDLARLSAGAVERARHASWTASVAPLAAQLRRWFEKRWRDGADERRPG